MNSRYLPLIGFEKSLQLAFALIFLLMSPCTSDYFFLFQRELNTAVPCNAESVIVAYNTWHDMACVE